MGRVTYLEQNEPVRLDPVRLDDLFLKLGQRAAENAVCSALDELATLLKQIERVGLNEKLPPSREAILELGKVADQLGMPLLARISKDVSTCIALNDPAARSATLARLLRIGKRSLSEIWDIHDH